MKYSICKTSLTTTSDTSTTNVEVASKLTDTNEV